MTSQYITIQINGEPFNCLSQMSLLDIISYLNIDSRLVLLEYNGIILSDMQISNIFVNQNDKLEIITIVGGG
jgi:sulfur carrier protein|uniref:Thiamine biosynthesis protein S n=1 Tax=Thorea hispida TaxID=202687 RepID=A0A1C9CAN9_9FLOR|nr:thiamine biosynthesis protein S [Thorea hispida]AOM65434.1 thiamine biosynthesis protein S [Thorea hispida]ARX95803.1 thiamine biosynthesis protein S [Thorea hispida]UNJ79093.1 thiamine biosynthesis protein S [Thorea hispida]